MLNFEPQNLEFRFSVHCPLEQAAQVVRFYSDSDDAVVERFLTTVFSEQQDILNPATADKTKAEVEAIFELWALATGAVSAAEFQR